MKSAKLCSSNRASLCFLVALQTFNFVNYLIRQSKAVWEQQQVLQTSPTASLNEFQYRGAGRQQQVLNSVSKPMRLCTGCERGQDPYQMYPSKHILVP